MDHTTTSPRGAAARVARWAERMWRYQHAPVFMAPAHALEINLEPSLGSIWFDETRTGPATELVPEWVEEVLGGS